MRWPSVFADNRNKWVAPFSPDAASQLTAVADDDSAYAFTYDNLGRVTEVDNGTTPDMPHVVLTMAWDAGNRRTSLAAEVDTDDDFLNAYTYDNLGRMTRVTQDGQSGGNSVEEKRVDLEYNALGQYASITRYADVAGTLLVATTTYTFDDAYRLTSLEHAQNSTTLAEYTWTYDTAGRLTAESNPDGTVDYTYDDLGQLTAADRSSGPDETYTYDENGNRTNTGYTTTKATARRRPRSQAATTSNTPGTTATG